MSEITLNIEGMHCGACVRRVTQALERVPGAEVVEVRIGAARLNTDDAAQAVAAQAVAALAVAAQAVAALAKAGYTARPEA